MSTLEKEIRDLSAEAQDISHGIWESLESLADCVADGTVSQEEAREQLAGLRSDLAEAAAS